MPTFDLIDVVVIRGTTLIAFYCPMSSSRLFKVNQRARFSAHLKAEVCVHVRMRAHVCMLIRTSRVSASDGNSQGSAFQSR